MSRRIVRILLAVLLVSIFLTTAAAAARTDTIFPSVSVSIGGENSPDNGGSSLQILFLITILSLLPSIFIMMTSFTRIIIVLSFVRNALGLQQTPPNQILVGLALLLSLFIMSPVIDDINANAYGPYINGEITQKAALEKAAVPIRSFMLKQTKNEDMKLFISLSKDQIVQSMDDVKLNVVIAAFITSEMKRAFTIGFLIFIPFLIIDMVVASVLMSMGMMMLPPVMISLPFKIMLFVLVDGWGLIIKTLVLSFH